MRQFRLSQAAQDDIAQILARSRTEFGEQTQHRYEALIVAALRDAAAARGGIGSTARPELGEGVFSWHFQQSRGRTSVRRPRHFLIYRIEGDRILVGRVLHDAMELCRHVDPETGWE